MRRDFAALRPVIGDAGLYFALGVVATVAVMQLMPRAASSAGQTPPQTTLGREKRRGERAFVLAVELRFSNEKDAKVPACVRAAARAPIALSSGIHSRALGKQELVSAWSEAANYCMANEPFLFHYEVSRSDKDPVRQSRG